MSKRNLDPTKDHKTRTSEPLVTETGRDRKTLTHNAFGLINVYRTQSNGKTLYGSALRHNNYVSVEIHTSSLDRKINQDWHGQETMLLRFCMSESQWAQFISSQGMGSGTPITFELGPVDGSLVEYKDLIAPQSTKKIFHDEVSESIKHRLEDGEKAQNMLKALLEKKTVSKADIKDVLGQLQKHMQHIPADFAYMQESFHEAVEKTVEAGKTEIEAFINAVAVKTGIEALRNGTVSLEHTPEPAVPNIDLSWIHEGNSEIITIDPEMYDNMLNSPQAVYCHDVSYPYGFVVLMTDGIRTNTAICVEQNLGDCMFKFMINGNVTFRG